MDEHDTTSGTQSSISGTAAVTSSKSKRIIAPIIIGLVVIVLVVAGLTWHVVSVKRQVEAAKAACDSGLESARSAVKDWLELTASDQVKTATAITKIQVADVETVDTLDKLTGTMITEPTTCNGSTVDDYEKITASNARLQQKAEDAKISLNKAVQAVNYSKDTKTLQDAQSALRKTLDSAKQTYMDSDGNVLDETVRTDLQSLIDQANQMSSDVKSVNELNTKLNTAITNVTETVKAKQEADAQAQAEAEAAAQAQAQTPGYTNTWNNQQTTTTPQTTVTPSAPSTPVTSTPSTPNSEENTNDDVEWIGCNAFESPTGSCETDWF